MFEFICTFILNFFFPYSLVKCSMSINCQKVIFPFSIGWSLKREDS